jgi:hypothetical protein
VSHAVNILRGEGAAAENKRKIHCAHGHLLDGDNLAIRTNGNRSCRACSRKRTRDYRQRQKAKQAPGG